MWLLIDADQNPATGWQGYDFIVNRMPVAKGKSWLEKKCGRLELGKGFTSQAFGLKGSELQLAIPRKALGLPTSRTQVAIDFKWADHLQRPGEIMDFYSAGTSRPKAASITGIPASDRRFRAKLRQRRLGCTGKGHFIPLQGFPCFSRQPVAVRRGGHP